MARLTNEQITKLLYNSLTELDEKLKSDIKSRENNTDQLRKYYYSIESKIEELKKVRLKVDTSELERLLKKRNKEEKDILSRLESFKEKNETRLPSYVLIPVLITFLVSLGLILIFGYEVAKMNGIL